MLGDRVVSFLRRLNVFDKFINDLIDESQLYCSIWHSKAADYV